MAPTTSGTFKENQKKEGRVKKAYANKEESLKKLVKSKGLDYASLQIYIRAFKFEKELEVWGKDKNTSKFKLIKTYNFCKSSGDLGPKRKSGDGQIPEGFYHIDRFNPWSNFHLSLGVNYPNKSDKKKSPHKDLGGDIFLHGNCVTIGCIPLTDDKIEELYVLAVEAKDNGQSKIPVHIFPIKLSKTGMIYLRTFTGASEKLKKFWKNLEQGYTLFESNRKIPSVSVAENGDYKFSN